MDLVVETVAADRQLEKAGQFLVLTWHHGGDEYNQVSCNGEFFVVCQGVTGRDQQLTVSACATEGGVSSGNFI